jgi:aspartyl/glutamyl-tRNA(Asn/Gln) amidotransferase C subunit
VRIDRELIARVARLASLEPSESESEALAVELTRIVEHFEALRQVPEELLPLAPLPPPGPLREDRAREPGAPSFAMENAPESARGHFVVPRVVSRG